MLDISFRRLCMYVINCKTRFHRLTSFKTYTLEDYEQLINEKNVQRKMKIKPISKTVFVQTDDMRNMYDTLEMVEDLKKDFLDPVESKAIIEKNDILHYQIMRCSR